MLHLEPCGKAVEWTVALRQARDDAGLVPVDRAAVLGEGPALDDYPRIQADIGGLDFQTCPLACFGKRTHGPSLGRGVRSERNHIVAPISAMLPGPGVPLKHNLLGRLGRVQVNVAEELVAFTNAESGLGIFK